MNRLERTERSLLCPVLVAREREVDVLTDALDVGGVVVLAGEAGVGKTRLTREVTDEARRRGRTVLAGRAVPTSTPVPYRPLTEALLGALRSRRPEDLPDLAGFAGQLGRLVPAWRDVGAGGGADESPVLLGEAVVRLLRAIGGDDGVVIVLEDLHWADIETLAVVEYLADALHGEQSLCLCTARNEGAAVHLLARLRRNDSVTLLGVDRLDGASTASAVAACLDVAEPPADVVASIVANSEGNPFLVEELLAGLVSTCALRRDGERWVTSGPLVPAVPFDFGESIHQRLATLDDVARRVLRAAALLGRKFDWELLPSLVDVDGKAVVDALRVAIDEQLIEVDGEAFRFRHALTREAVLAELLPPERRSLAQRALPAVERAHPGLPDVWCELAADLAQEAGERDVAARHLVESASRALASGALASAEATCGRVLSLTDAIDIVNGADVVLVQALATAGKLDAAARIGDALLDRLGDDERATEVALVLARAALGAGNGERAQALVERAGPSSDAASLAVAAHVALQQDRLDDAIALASDAVQRARSTSQPAVECEALEVLGRVQLYRQAGDTSRFEDSAELARKHGLTSWEVRARHEKALVEAYMHGRRTAMEEARAFAEENGALVSVAAMDLALAEIALEGYNGPTCVERAQTCVDASDRYGLAALPVANLWLAGGCALLQDHERMESAIAASLQSDPDDPRILGDLWGRVRATDAIVRDHRDDLRRALDTMMTYVRIAPITTSVFPARVLWAVLHAIDDDDLGAAAGAELRGAEHLLSWPVFIRSLGLLDGIALGRAGRPEEATATAASSVDAIPTGLGEGSMRYLTLVVAEAQVRDGWGDPVPLLRGAAAFFGARGFDAIVRRCHSLLAAAGAPVPRRGRGDAVVPERLRAMGVTSREMDVLALVGEGLSNREVATRLFLSPKTVERHLSSLFDRTGRRSRGELADLLRELPG